MFSFQAKNQSTQVTDTDLATWMAAVNVQASTDFPSVWGYAGEAGGTPLNGDIIVPVNVLDASPSPGTLGEHNIDANGVPYIDIYATETLSAGVAISSVISHEVLEVLGDPFIESITLAQRNRRVGDLYAAEVCDPVEADLYQINGVNVSNFVTPWWFSPAPPAGAKFDFLGHLTAPFTLTPGGYFQTLTVRLAGGWQQHMGDQAKPWGGASEDKSGADGGS